MADVLEIPNLPIRVTERGEWLHGDAPLHPRVAALFKRSVVPHSDGTYELVVGRDRHPLVVADTPYAVEGMHLQTGPSGEPAAVAMRLSDGEEEPLDPATLMLSDEHVLYGRVVRHGLEVPCRFPPSLYHQLALHVEAAPDGFELPLAGRRWPMSPYDPRPRPVE